MSNKLSNGLSVAVGIFLMGAIGFSAATANSYIQNDVSHISEYITDDMQNKAWIIYLLIPGICMLLSSIPMFFYKINEKTKKQMREELALRRSNEEKVEETFEDASIDEQNEEIVENQENKKEE